MRSSAQVVVIGGGVVGASVLFHLTEAGWNDVVLVERKELTAGSTWHSAGGMHTLNGDPNVSKLQQYTIELYRTIEERSGQHCSIHLPGGLMLANDRERLDWLRMAQARGRYLGMELEIISTAEAKAMFPLLEEQYFVGALYDPVEGHLDPSGVTNAYAICARRARRRGQPAHVGVRPPPATRWHVGRDHRPRRDPCRAHRQRRRAVGPRGRADDRTRAARAGDGAHVPRHRGHGRGRRAQRGDRSRDADGPRLRGRDLHPPGAGRDADGDVRAGVRAVVAADGAVDVRHGAAGARPRPHRPVAGGRLQALPGDGDGRDQAHRQRAVHVRPRRQPAGRADPRDPQLLGGLRGDGRAVAGRRCRPGAGQLDDDGRPAARHLGHGRRPLRRLGEPRLHQRQGARELQQALPHHVPQRGAAGGPAAAHDAGVRPPDRAQRGVGRRLRARARAVVPATRSSNPSRR